MKTPLFLLYPQPSDDFSRKVFCQRVHLFHKQSLLNIPIMMLGTGCLAWFQFVSETPIEHLWIWIAAFLITTIAIIICDRLYRELCSFKELRNWIILRCSIGLIAFLLYGLSPFLIPETSDQIYSVILYTILLFIWFMSLFSINIIPEYYLAATLVLLPPLSYFMLAQEQYLNMMLTILLPLAILVALPKAFLLTKTSISDISYQLLLQQEVEDHHKAKQQIGASALYDELTGIANKRFFLETSQIMIASTLRMHKRVGLVMLEIDNAAQLSLQLDLNNMQKTLKVTADRIASSIRSSDIAARIDEFRFAILIVNLDSENQLDILIASLTNKLSNELPLRQPDTHLSVSIASSIAPDDGHDINCLFRTTEQRLKQISKLRKRRNG